MNEEDFVDFIKEKFKFSYGVGIGDDCSVTRKGDIYQLITTDILIEDIHFDLKYFTLLEVALKSIAVNLSDIAAMGGEAKYFYLSAGFPNRFFDKGVEEFFRSIESGCQEWGIELAGGDISRSDKLVISITMIGESDKPVMRNGAKEGDLIGITGLTGESYTGLQLLKKGKNITRFIKKHKSIKPELEKGLILKNYVNSMIDVSDGVLMDLERILHASDITGCNIEYEKIPVDEEMRMICNREEIDEYRAVLSGGEDFVLLFTISKDREKDLQKEKIDHFIIGKISDEPGIKVTNNGKSLNYLKTGFDHFADSV
jgi:thiamine-monophosphate kinase